MNSGHDLGPEPGQPKLFLARLTPHRSLGRAGFTALMIFFGAVSIVAGVVFWWIGAWPVIGFVGLDLIAIALAFKIYFRRARAREEISVTPSELRVRRISHRGDVVEWVLNPLWVRLDQIGHDEFGITNLYLVSSGRRVGIASCLGAEEKADFAKALSAALAAARRGVTMPSAL